MVRLDPAPVPRCSSAAVISHFDETLARFGMSMLTLGAPEEVRWIPAPASRETQH